jgi:membrane protein
MLGALRTSWDLTRRTVLVFIDDAAISRGAAIAFYAITSLGPILLIVVAIAGLAYGEDAARGVLMAKLSGFMGEQSASFLQAAISSAWRHGGGTFTALIGVASLLLTATGLFAEMQAALNAIWGVTPPPFTVWGLLRGRLIGLSLVLGLALVLVATATISTVVTALQNQLNDTLPASAWFFDALNFLVSLAVLTFMVGAIYKVLPDLHLRWSDVIVGAVVTALLIAIGKVLIALYIGRTGVVSSYGAAGSVLAVMLWIYYSAQICLLGAEFTRVHAEHRARRGRVPAAAAAPVDRAAADQPRASRLEHSH